MSTTIDILVIADAEAIISDYQNPSKSQMNPTMIDSRLMYMVASSNAVSGDGTGDLRINASVGDTVNFSCVTPSNNRVSSALIYDIRRTAGSNVFSNFSSKSFAVSTMEPAGPSVLPPMAYPQKVWVFTASVIATGSENYGPSFALYKNSANMQSELVGYFTWDPIITVEN